ncbi:MAG: protein YgfX [Burkholderiales bacterium]|nr:protein YgfX [Burkholderiales bacterium]
MHDDVCEVNNKNSKIAIFILITSLAIIISLLQYSNFHSIVKLASLTITSLYVFYIFFQYNSSYTSRYEILFELKNLIVWNNHTPQLMTIIKWYTIGNICAIIKARNKNMNKTLIIFKDSCPNNAFKQIMKRIKWSPIQSS